MTSVDSVNNYDNWSAYDWGTETDATAFEQPSQEQQGPSESAAPYSDYFPQQTGQGDAVQMSWPGAGATGLQGGSAAVPQAKGNQGEPRKYGNGGEEPSQAAAAEEPATANDAVSSPETNDTVEDQAPSGPDAAGNEQAGQSTQADPPQGSAETPVKPKPGETNAKSPSDGTKPGTPEDTTPTKPNEGKSFLDALRQPNQVASANKSKSLPGERQGSAISNLISGFSQFTNPAALSALNATNNTLANNSSPMDSQTSGADMAAKAMRAAGIFPRDTQQKYEQLESLRSQMERFSQGDPSFDREQFVREVDARQNDYAKETASLRQQLQPANERFQKARQENEAQVAAKVAEVDSKISEARARGYGEDSPYMQQLRDLRHQEEYKRSTEFENALRERRQIENRITDLEGLQDTLGQIRGSVADRSASSDLVRQSSTQLVEYMNQNSRELRNNGIIGAFDRGTMLLKDMQNIPKDHRQQVSRDERDWANRPNAMHYTDNSPNALLSDSPQKLEQLRNTMNDVWSKLPKNDKGQVDGQAFKPEVLKPLDAYYAQSKENTAKLDAEMNQNWDRYNQIKAWDQQMRQQGRYPDQSYLYNAVQQYNTSYYRAQQAQQVQQALDAVYNTANSKNNPDALLSENEMQLQDLQRTMNNLQEKPPELLDGRGQNEDVRKLSDYAAQNANNLQHLDKALQNADNTRKQAAERLSQLERQGLKSTKAYDQALQDLDKARRNYFNTQDQIKRAQQVRDMLARVNQGYDSNGNGNGNGMHTNNRLDAQTDRLKKHLAGMDNSLSSRSFQSPEAQARGRGVESMLKVPYMDNKRRAEATAQENHETKLQDPALAGVRARGDFERAYLKLQNHLDDYAQLMLRQSEIVRSLPYHLQKQKSLEENSKQLEQAGKAHKQWLLNR